jgi:hypothetical protein
MLLLHLWVIIYQNWDADRCVEACHNILVLVCNDNQKVDLIPCPRNLQLQNPSILVIKFKIVIVSMT